MTKGQQLRLFRNAQIVGYFDISQSIEEVANQFNLSTHYIKDILKENNIILPDNRGKNQTIAPLIVERNRQIFIMYLENYSLKECGDKFSITRERVRQLLNKNGIKPREYTVRILPLKPRKRLTTRERFWSFVDKTPGQGRDGDCWVWIGGTNPVSGYARFTGTNIFKKEKNAHRIAYRLATGKKPKLWVLHTCDNPPCVNPNHLYEGTPKQNSDDRDSRGRGAHQREGWGEMIRKARESKPYYPLAGKKLDVEKVRQIRVDLRNGVRQSVLAAKYDVHPHTIHLIHKRHRWAHVE